MEMKPLRTIIVPKWGSKDVHAFSALQGTLYSSALHRNGTPPWRVQSVLLTVGHNTYIYWCYAQECKPFTEKQSVLS